MMIQRNLIAALLTGGLLTLPAHAQNAEVQTFGAAGGTPQVLWSLPIGEEDSDDDEVDGIAVDDGGNVAISGIMRGGLRLGGEMMAARGQGDIFLARYGADGGLQWKKAIGGSGDDNAFDLQMDGSGNIIISGWFAGQVDFASLVFVCLEGAEGNLFAVTFIRPQCFHAPTSVVLDEGVGGVEDRVSRTIVLLKLDDLYFRLRIEKRTSRNENCRRDEKECIE